MEIVDYGKALDWDDEVEYSEPEFTLLPPGDYNFTVTGFEREHYPGGAKLPACDKAVFSITIEAPEGRTTIKHNFFMLEYMKGYLHQFFVSIGQFKPGESGRPKWNATVGSKGRCKVGIREWVSDRDGEKRQSNEIKKFYPPLAKPTQSFKAGEF